MSVLSFLIRELLSRLPGHGQSAPAESKPTALYDPRIFDVADLESAKWVILNPTPDMSVEERRQSY